GNFELQIDSIGSISLNPGQSFEGGRIHLGSSDHPGQWTVLQHAAGGESALLSWSTPLGQAGVKGITNSGAVELWFFNPAPIWSYPAWEGGRPGFAVTEHGVNVRGTVI